MVKLVSKVVYRSMELTEKGVGPIRSAFGLDDGLPDDAKAGLLLTYVFQGLGLYYVG